MGAGHIELGCFSEGVDASDLHLNVVHALQSGPLLTFAKSRSNETGTGVICLVVEYGSSRQIGAVWKSV